METKRSLIWISLHNDRYSLPSGKYCWGILILLSGIIAFPNVRESIREQTGIRVNRWSAATIVIVLMLTGWGITTGGELTLNTDNSGINGEDTQLIEQPATELLPTIDDFESGWRGEVDGDGTADYINVESEENVQYNVTVYDSVESAERALESCQPENAATSDVDIADAGYKYPLSENLYVVQIRERNVICETTYQGSIATFNPEGNAESLAQTCANQIK